MQRLMVARSSTMPVKVPRCRRRRVRAEKKPPTALGQEAEGGVKWKVRREWWASQAQGARWAKTRAIGPSRGGQTTRIDVLGRPGVRLPTPGKTSGVRAAAEAPDPPRQELISGALADPGADRAQALGWQRRAGLEGARHSYRDRR